MVKPPTALPPLNVTKSSSTNPPFVSVTNTVVDPDVVVNGLVNDWVARKGVTSLKLPPNSM